MIHRSRLLLSNILILMFLGSLYISKNTKEIVIDTTTLSRNNQNLDSLFTPSKGKIIYINKEINLDGKTVIVPPACALEFSGNGCIINGIVCGNQTKIYGSTERIFDNVKIQGTWLVRNISSGMFRHTERINTLKEVINLSSDSCNNIIVIKKGEYNLTIEKNEIAALRLKSNTTLINHGVIKILPNNLQRNYIIWCDRVKNVTIQGGKIIGDRQEHIGSEGEWGYGICATRTTNLNINKVEIEQCWGDCICLGVDNSNVTISYCKLHDSRRQGITVAGRENIRIKKCKIYNIKGTDPQSAIDIEPDANGRITDVCIEGVTINNCKIGILAYGGADNVVISNIRIKNVSVSSLFDCQDAFYFAYADSIYIDKCRAQNLNAVGVRIENCKGEVHLTKNTLRSIGKSAIINTGIFPIKMKNNNILGKIEGHVVKQ